MSSDETTGRASANWSEVSHCLGLQYMMTHWCFQDIDTPDPNEMPETLEEAECILGVAYAQRSICQAEVTLADLRVKESRLRAQLYVIRADKVKKKLDDADIKVGSARNSVRESGHWEALKSQEPPKRKRIKQFRGK
jgi:hypothetical protein